MPVQRKRFALDSNARRSANGTALFGGSPFRLLRLSQAGSDLVDRWLAGEADEGASSSAVALRNRLVDAGLLHPVYPAEVSPGDTSVGVVVPVFDDADGLARLLPALRRDLPRSEIVVVDDGSPDGQAIVDVAESNRARLVRLPRNGGPSAARNVGWRALDTKVVVFVDSDVTPVQGCIDRLRAHFSDDAVVAVAPRVRPMPGHSTLDRYEAVSSPLDLGPNRAIVRPGSPVPYVPTTLLAVRRETLRAVDGLDEQLRQGEDVDLVWRIIAEGGVVRYESDAVAHHRNRPSWTALARQRHGYGTAAAELDRRHPGDVAPVEIPAPMLTAWAVPVVLGAPGIGAGAAISVAEAVRLFRRLPDGTPDRLRETLALSWLGHRHAARWLAHAVRRAWLPLLLPAAFASSRIRRLLVAAVLGGAGADWLQDRPAIDPVRFTAARSLDDAAYCSGLWRGMLRRRSPRALLPRTRPRRAG